MECSETFTDKIEKDSFDEADLLYCCISFCNSRVGSMKELSDGVEGSGCVVCVGNGRDEVEVVAVVKGCKCWSFSGCWCWYCGEIAFVDEEGVVIVGSGRMC
jgi:hypothetical protein